MRRMIEGEVAAARADAEAARETLQALESDVVPRARSAVNAALAAYASGQGTLVLVVDASRALWDTERDRVMAQTQASEAWALLELALGNTALPEGDEP
jgi:outer membrane protein TolC